jgi:ArpU family phage transcriptional regulator
MLKKDIFGFIVAELEAYKRNRAVYKALLIENNISIPAQVLSDMPRSQTNKFNSSTENQALSNRLYQLEREISRVENWMTSLNPEEKFVIEKFYMDNQTYPTISNNWRHRGGLIYSESFWKNRRRQALCKIYDVCVQSCVK